MLNVITVEEAIKILKDNFTVSSQTETVYLDESFGRIAAEDIFSGEDVPSFFRSTMDGYALCAADTYGSGESMPAMLDIKGEILMGECADTPIKNGECFKISTGGMLPVGADAVIPVENTDEDNGVCLIYKSVSPFENVIKKGDDIKIGECVVKKGTYLSPAHIGLLASVGKSKINV
ncbi:MAG: molybdopterin molybdenumtransferase MoeA, partial [Ruminococcus sp.]|nr:molybdopterin molybdenumtransferase MoeA [Candidatus Copronaster equi]